MTIVRAAPTPTRFVSPGKSRVQFTMCSIIQDRPNTEKDKLKTRLSIICPATIRTRLVISLLLACLVFVGCSQSGDFGNFFVGEVTKYGHPPTTPITVSRLDARWTIQSDNDGFRIIVRGQPFAAVDALIRQVIGAPKVSVDSNVQGRPHQVYGSAEIGLAVQCIGRADDVEIICLKGSSMWWNGGTN